MKCINMYAPQTYSESDDIGLRLSLVTYKGGGGVMVFGI